MYMCIFLAEDLTLEQDWPCIGLTPRQSTQAIYPGPDGGSKAADVFISRVQNECYTGLAGPARCVLEQSTRLKQLFPLLPAADHRQSRGQMTVSRKSG